MNSLKIEKALKNAIGSAPAIPFENIASSEFVQMPEHDFITKQAKTNKSLPFRRFALSLACCLLLLVSVSGWYLNYKVSDSIILLDVNPSIEIRTNQKNQILSITALNDDAKVVLDDLNYSVRHKMFAAAGR
jgi:hypothetical protein